MERWKQLVASWERMAQEELVEQLGAFWPAFSSIKDGEKIWFKYLYVDCWISSTKDGEEIEIL